MNKYIFILAIVILLTGCIPARPNSNGAASALVQKSLHKLELPTITSSDEIVSHMAYTSSFNSKRNIPNWVAYELTPEEARGTTPRPKNSPFCEDPSYKGTQPSRRDYSNNENWDKGHMAPCADMKLSEQTMMESFYFTNVCPQNRSINAGDWQKLEELVHNMAAKSGKTIYIVCGPIVKENKHGVLGEAKIAIPDNFFKALLYKDERGYHSIAFVLPNEPSSKPLRNYSLTVNDLEIMIGINLFAALDLKIQEDVESKVDLSAWNL